MSRLIIYKDLDHERFGDAPFIGALLIAAQCTRVCPNCFNQHLKEMENKFSTATNLIREVMRNPLNEGIILGGLEWTEQPEDLMDIVREALSNSLKVMIYTGLTEDEFIQKFPRLQHAGIYCKFGSYDERFLDNAYFSQGVKLATKNQYIRYMGR